MNLSSGSIKGELSDAVRSGIRHRGPDAIGLVLVGMARLIVGTATLGVLLAVGAVSGYDITAPKFAGVTGAAALINWLLGGRTQAPGTD